MTVGRSYVSLPLILYHYLLFIIFLDLKSLRLQSGPVSSILEVII